MGLFKKTKQEPQAAWPTPEQEAQSLQAREVKFASGDLANLLDTAGGGYVRPGPPDLISTAANHLRTLPVDERERWEGVAWLYKGQSNGYDVVDVMIRGVKVSKLTKESVASIWEKIDQPTPVRCVFGWIGNNTPSLTLYVNKS